MIAWVAQRLDTNILEIVIQKRQVIKRTKKPSARQNAAKMLEAMGYDWASTRNHSVVKSLEDTLSEIQEEREAIHDNGWEEEVICEFPEDVLNYFVDVDGNPTGCASYDIDKDGRQSISFFVKTVCSRERAAPARFKGYHPPTNKGVGSSSSRRRRSQSSRHSEDSDDVSAMSDDGGGPDTETASIIDEKFHRMGQYIQESTNHVRNEMRQEFRTQLQDVMGDFVRQLNMAGGMKPVPDGAQSAGGI